jgi:hypothetical protein
VTASTLLQHVRDPSGRQAWLQRSPSGRLVSIALEERSGKGSHHLCLSKAIMCRGPDLDAGPGRPKLLGSAPLESSHPDPAVYFTRDEQGRVLRIYDGGDGGDAFQIADVTAAVHAAARIRRNECLSTKNPPPRPRNIVSKLMRREEYAFEAFLLVPLSLAPLRVRSSAEGPEKYKCVQGGTGTKSLRAVHGPTMSRRNTGQSCCDQGQGGAFGQL